MYPADDDFLEEESSETIEVHESIEKKKPVKGILSRGASMFGQT
jgi:hypothetical protein